MSTMDTQTQTNGHSEQVAPDTSDVYQLDNVSKLYGSGSSRVTALADVSLTISHGEFVVIMGPSGSGKTTLLQMLGALDRPSSGQVRLAGADLTRASDRELSRLRRDTIGFIFQQFNLIPTLTASQNVEAAIATTDLGRAERERRASELLEVVGLSPRSGHLPSQLSGGEQQRVAIARALANRPQVLLADEPTGNLDSTTGEEILALLRRLSAEQQLTVVLITHDPAIAAAAPRLLRMRDGRLLLDQEEPEPASIFSDRG
ncbi:MAG: putative transport system ATP-binding protein [Gaiellales bacterium]|jgi:putative ABC transport system ATP-binding protein|nr:putative transport system ATP-binding protein [Gaiellales bacterium]